MADCQISDAHIQHSTTAEVAQKHGHMSARRWRWQWRECGVIVTEQRALWREAGGKSVQAAPQDRRKRMVNGTSGMWASLQRSLRR